MSHKLPDNYEVTDEIIAALADRTVERSLELNTLRRLRDGYQAAAQALAVMGRRHGVTKDAITHAIAATVVDLDASGIEIGREDKIGRTRLQLDAFRMVCEELMDVAELSGADRDELLEAVRSTVDMHVTLASGSTPEQLGLLG